MAYPPSKKRSRRLEGAEFSLVAVMSLMVILVLVLFAVSNTTRLAALNVTEAPGVSDSSHSPQMTKRLDLLVYVHKSGIEVSAFSATSGAHYRWIPARDGEQALDEFSEVLEWFKREVVGEAVDSLVVVDEVSQIRFSKPVYRYEDGDRVTISAKRSVVWEDILAVMARCRGGQEPLFPQVKLVRM